MGLADLIVNVLTHLIKSIFPGHVAAEGKVTSDSAIKKSVHAAPLLIYGLDGLENPLPFLYAKASPAMVVSSDAYLDTILVAPVA